MEESTVISTLQMRILRGYIQAGVVRASIQTHEVAHSFNYYAILSPLYNEVATGITVYPLLYP